MAHQGGAGITQDSGAYDCRLPILHYPDHAIHAKPRSLQAFLLGIRGAACLSIRLHPAARPPARPPLRNKRGAIAISPLPLGALIVY
jgi:hypothetical protein